MNKRKGKRESKLYRNPFIIKKMLYRRESIGLSVKVRLLNLQQVKIMTKMRYSLEPNFKFINCGTDFSKRRWIMK